MSIPTFIKINTVQTVKYGASYVSEVRPVVINTDSIIAIQKCQAPPILIGEVSEEAAKFPFKTAIRLTGGYEYLTDTDFTTLLSTLGGG